MRIFHDHEFLEDGRRIYPISVGMVAEDGRELYLVNAEMPAPLIADRPWLMDNVVPHLPTRHSMPGPMGGTGGVTLDFFHDDVQPLDVIRAQVLDFIRATPDPQLWAWYGAFDHVSLAWLFGAMIDMPHVVPWFTNDIRTLALLAGVGAQAREPKQQGREHHALDDAKHDRELFHYYAPLVDLDRLK